MILYSKGIDIMSKKKSQNKTIKKDEPIIVEPINEPINEPIKNDSEPTEYYKILEDEKNYLGLKIFSVIIVILIIITAFYFYVFRNPKNIIMNSLNQVYNYANNILNQIDTTKLLETPTVLDTTFKINTNNPKENDLINDTFSYKLGINTYLNNYYQNLTINNLDNILDTTLYYQNSNYYLKLIMDNEYIISINSLDNDYLANISYINYAKLSSAFKDIKGIINKRIDASKIKTGKNNDYVALNMTKSEESNLLSLIIGDIKTNHGLMLKLNNTFNCNDEQINNFLDELLKKHINSNYETIEYKIITKGIFSKIIGFTISTDNIEKLKILFDDNLTIKYQDNGIEFSYQNNIINFNYQNNKGTIKINEFDNDIGDFDYEINDNKGNIHLTINKDNNDYVGTLAISYINDYSYSIDLGYHLTSQNTIDMPEIDDIDNILYIDENTYLDIYNKINNNFKNSELKKPIIAYWESLMK
jgi:hypothetical protein